MDSRRYVFAFAIKSPTGIPDDFGVEVRNEPFDAGLFLPQDDPDWFGRVEYPARILLLQKNSLFIAFHPSCEKNPIRIPFSDLQEVEVGRVMLLGWLRFQFAGSSCRLPYNRRGSAPVEDFLMKFHRRWPEPAAVAAGKQESEFGEPLDLKFRNMRDREIACNEDLLLQFFEPSRQTYTRFLLLFRLRNWKPGDLVAVKSNCVSWITDRNDDRMEFYGSVAYRAPLSALQNITCREDPVSPVLELTFLNSIRWRIPIYRDFTAAASQFTAAVRQLQPIRTASNVEQ